MANKCIDYVTYRLPSQVEIRFNPHAVIADWTVLDQGIRSLLSVNDAKILLKTIKPKRIEVKLKDNFGGEVYSYKHGQVIATR